MREQWAINWYKYYQSTHTPPSLIIIPGQFGRYQGFQFFLHILAALTAGLHMLSLVTVASVPTHRCLIAELDTNLTETPVWNETTLRAFLPPKEDGSLDHCRLLINGSAEQCDSYIYDNTYYKSSRSMEWGMVCNKRWMGAIAQSVFMLGVFTGAVVLGGLADKVGRKTVFCWSALLQLILGVAVAFAPEYISFLVLRYLLGIFGSAGSYITGFVLTMELVGSNYRTICGVTFQAIFACGVMLVAGWGALIQDRMMLQIVYGLHGALLIAHWWIMDESPRWLWNQGRFQESIDIVAKALKMNREPSLDKTYYASKTKSSDVASSGSQPSANLSDLFKTPNLRKKTLNVCVNWFANSLVYYGLSLGTGNLPGNPFMILFINAVVEIPSYIAVVLLLDKLGRRSITSFLMLLGGICCIVAVQMVKGSTLTTTIVMMGKLFIAGSFAVIYNYSAELFPTVVRNSAMGLGSMCARLSGALCPLIALLDSFDPKVPAMIFGAVSILSGFWTLFLPETMNQPMPESLDDGEHFGKGDTFFTTGFGRAPAPVRETTGQQEMQPLRRADV